MFCTPYVLMSASRTFEPFPHQFAVRLIDPPERSLISTLCIPAPHLFGSSVRAQRSDKGTLAEHERWATERIPTFEGARQCDQPIGPPRFSRRSRSRPAPVLLSLKVAVAAVAVVVAEPAVAAEQLELAARAGALAASRRARQAAPRRPEVQASPEAPSTTTA
jgi:hypothetical protein